VKALKSAYTYLQNTKLEKISSSQLSKDLLQLELKQVVTYQKIGVLLCREGQIQEEDMFSNVGSTPLFDEFLSFLGDVVPLKGFRGFAGGLDVKQDSTGTQSVYTKFKGLELMFHIATYLPFNPKDPQQVERKRHIGNDIVVIIFNESNAPFSPSCITSEYNHVYAVIQPMKENGTTKYRIGFAYKTGTPSSGPLLAEPAVFEKSEKLKDWLLTKLINAERAAFNAPSFASKIKRTRRILLEEIVKKYVKSK